MRIKKKNDGVEVKIDGEELKRAKVKVDTSEIETEMVRKDEKIAELTGDLQRTRADFENYRKQIEARELAAKKVVRNETVRKILPLLDDIDRAVESYAELKPLLKSLDKTMGELGLSKIPVEAGAEFDPELAEAVMAEGEGEKEVVSEVLRPGYYYENEVLRPAMVKVQKM